MIGPPCSSSAKPALKDLIAIYDEQNRLHNLKDTALASDRNLCRALDAVCNKVTERAAKPPYLLQTTQSMRRSASAPLLTVGNERWLSRELGMESVRLINAAWQVLVGKASLPRAMVDGKETDRKNGSEKMKIVGVCRLQCWNSVLVDGKYIVPHAT